MRLPTSSQLLALIRRDPRCQIALSTFGLLVLIGLFSLPAATSGLLLLGGLLLLLYIGYFVASALQTHKIVAELGADLRVHMAHLFPAHIGRSGVSPRREPAPALPERFAEASEPLPAMGSQYLQMIDGDRLMALAETHELVIHVMHRPGEFVLQDSPLAHVYPAEKLTHGLRDQLAAAFTLADRRADTQDVDFTIERLVEIACRALSPANNDPFTAVACIDWLSAGLRALTGQPIPSPFRYDAKGYLRVIAPSTSFSQLADKSFAEIRHVASGSPAVVIRLLDTARELARFARRAEDRRWLRRHIDSVKEESDRYISSAQDRERITASYQAAQKAIPGDRPPTEK